MHTLTQMPLFWKFIARDNPGADVTQRANHFIALAAESHANANTNMAGTHTLPSLRASLTHGVLHTALTSKATGIAQSLRQKNCHCAPKQQAILTV